MEEKEKINNFFVDCFNEILHQEEMKLSHIGNGNLSVSEIHVLEAISRVGNNTASEVAKYLRITQGTLTVTVATLIKKGYVYKDKDERDKRVTRIYLTDFGKQVNEHHLQFHKDMIDGVVDYLDYDEVQTLTNALLKIKNYFMEKK